MTLLLAVICSFFFSPAFAFFSPPPLTPFSAAGLSPNAPLSPFLFSALSTTGNPVLPARTPLVSRLQLATSSSSPPLAPEPEVHVANTVSVNTFNAVFILLGPFWSLLSHAILSTSRALGITPPPQDSVLSDVRGKIVVVTGASTGIGRHTASSLYARGATVVMACRSEERGEKARTEIEQEHKGIENTGSLVVKLLDLADLHSVRAFAESVTEAFPQIDILVNNAGVAQIGRVPRTEQGLDGVYGVNYLAHFYLTSLLLPALQRAAAARIVNLASVMHHCASSDLPLALEEMLKRKQSESAYSDSKLNMLLFTLELRRRLFNTNVTSIAVNPGFVYSDIWRAVETADSQNIALPLAARLFRWYLRRCALSPALGAETSIAAATLPPAECVSASTPTAYLVPYYVPNRYLLRLLCESQGPFVGARSVPPRVPPNEPQVSAALWEASAGFCAEFERENNLDAPKS